MAIEREKILDTALSLMNEVGLDDFTTRRLAQRLGVQQPALYWHFRSKSALLDAINDEILVRYHDHRVPSPRETWEAFTLAHARSFRRALLAVRNGARINAGTRPSTQQFADAERHLELYVKAGFTPAEALGISIGVARFVTGFVLEEQDERDRQDEAPATLGDPEREIAPYPILAEAVKPMLASGTINTEGVFEAGLRYMIEGIKASLAAKRTRRRGQPPPPA